MTKPPRLLEPRTLGSLLAGLAAFLFCSAWYNRYFGVTTDGWFFHFATRLVAGEIPYRDFHLFAPPWHVFEQAALIELFGAKMYFPHLLGLLQRVVIAVVVFRLLERWYGASIALVASLTGLVVFSADIADTVFFYHHDSVFWSVLAIDAALRFHRVPAERMGRFFGMGALCGALAGIAFLDKQTTGLGVSVALPTILAALALRPHGPRAAAARVAPYALGWALPVGAVWAWLASHGAFHAYLDQVFLRASSKGTLGQVLARPIVDAFRNTFLQVAAPAALAALALCILAPWATRKLRAQGSNAPVGLLLAGAGIVLALTTASFWLANPRMPRLTAAYVSLFGTATIGAWLAWKWTRGPLSERDGERWILLASSFSLTYMFSLSWPAWELMVFPGLAVLIAEAWRRFDEELAIPGRAILVGACLLVVLVTVQSRAAVPYRWGDWTEPPIATATHLPDHPVLAGFELSPSTAAFLESAAAAIAANSNPEEPVFVFPHVPILYVLSDRRPATFCAVHWFDVVPDHLALADAETLRRDPPPVFASFPISQGEWRFNELQYRSGRPAAQREIVAVMEEWIESGRYRQVVALPGPISGQPLTVWARGE